MSTRPGSEKSAAGRDRGAAISWSFGIDTRPLRGLQGPASAINPLKAGWKMAVLVLVDARHEPGDRGSAAARCHR